MLKLKRHREKPAHAAKKPTSRKKHIWVGVTGVFMVLIIAGLAFALRATEGKVLASMNDNRILPVQKPFTIQLNRDLKVSKADISLTPADAIDYKFLPGKLGETKLIVTPKKQLRNNQEYRLTVKGLQHMLSRKQVPSQHFSFRTELAPGVASFGPTSGQVARDVSFHLVATDAASAKRNYALTLDPAVELETIPEGGTATRWKPKQPLKQGVHYKVRLTVGSQVLQDTTLQTVSEPKITTATAKKYFYPNEKITVIFDKPMKTDQKDTMQFPMPGAGEWQDDKTYVFTPDKLERNKEYKYTFKAGFTSKDGGVVEGNKTYAISTPGPATVVSMLPYGSNLRRNTPVRFNFDQPVNKTSAESRFKITPSVKGSFRWEGNSLIFIPNGYDWQTTYVAEVGPGVEAIHGVPSTTRASIRFSTEVQTVKLNAPAYRQAYKLSCEAAALRMALAKFGVHSDDMSITQRMGYSPRPLTNGQWEDPYSQFVGDINGKQWNNTGYGAYAPAVAKAARSFGREATSHTGVSANFIAAQIHAGRPVVVWGYQYTPTKFSWKTPSGQTIQAWQGEHTRTVVGVVGRADAPQGFYVTDPSYGSTSYWSVGSLMANMNIHGNLSNQAVVVY